MIRAFAATVGLVTISGWAVERASAQSNCFGLGITLPSVVQCGPCVDPALGRQGHCPGYEVVMFGSDECRPGEFGVTQCQTMTLLIGSRQRCGFSPIPAAMLACQAARQAAADACANQSEWCDALRRNAVLLCAPCRVNTCAPVGNVQPVFGPVRISHSGIPCPSPFPMVPEFQAEQLILPLNR